MWDEIKDFIFYPKGPVTDIFGEQIKDGVTNWAANIASDLITVAPILIGVSIGVYALINMISSKLAKMGVAGVFIYGALIVVF